MIEKLTDDLARECKEFLKNFGFRQLAWDGVELVAYREKNGEAFVAYEFTLGTPTRSEFDRLEDACIFYEKFTITDDE